MHYLAIVMKQLTCHMDVHLMLVLDDELVYHRTCHLQYAAGVQNATACNVNYSQTTCSVYIGDKKQSRCWALLGEQVG